MLKNFDFVVRAAVVEWLGEGISQQVIPVSSPVSKHSGCLSEKISISHNPYQARRPLN